MLKTLTAALIAASLLVAPGLTASADAGQRSQAGATTIIKPVKMVKKHKRHVVKHHKRGKYVKHYRQYKKYGLHRHGKAVKSHKRPHFVSTKVRARAN